MSTFLLQNHANEQNSVVSSSSLPRIWPVWLLWNAMDLVGSFPSSRRWLSDWLGCIQLISVCLTLLYCLVSPLRWNTYTVLTNKYSEGLPGARVSHTCLYTSLTALYNSRHFAKHQYLLHSSTAVMNISMNSNFSANDVLWLLSILILKSGVSMFSLILARLQISLLSLHSFNHRIVLWVLVCPMVAIWQSVASLRYNIYVHSSPLDQRWNSLSFSISRFAFAWPSYLFVLTARCFHS